MKIDRAPFIPPKRIPLIVGLIAGFVLAGLIFSLRGGQGPRNFNNKQTGNFAQETPQNHQNQNAIRLTFEARINTDLEKARPKLRQPHKGTNTYTDDRTFHGEFTGAFEINIEKTNSIVTPFIGVVVFTIKWFQNGTFVNYQTIRNEYGFQDGQWILKKAMRFPSPGRPNDDPEETIWVWSLFQ